MRARLATAVEDIQCLERVTSDLTAEAEELIKENKILRERLAAKQAEDLVKENKILRQRLVAKEERITLKGQINTQQDLIIARLTFELRECKAQVRNLEEYLLEPSPALLLIPETQEN